MVVHPSGCTSPEMNHALCLSILCRIVFLYEKHPQKAFSLMFDSRTASTGIGI